MRKIAILAEGAFTLRSAKTATGVIHYGKDQVVAVIDSTRAGQNVAAALKVSYGADIPVVRDIHEALALHPDTLMIGIAPVGGDLPTSWRWQILTALNAGLNLVSGLHIFLGEDPELQAAATSNGTTIWDVRRPPETKRVAEFLPHRPGSTTVLLVGSDCAVGKMTVALELDQAARQRGLKSTFTATGQTGIMIANSGLPVDHIISDFAAGLVEQMVLENCETSDWVFVEGQGALNHPGYSPVTLSLLHGSMPDLMILCHKAGATTIDGYPDCRLPSLTRCIQMNEDTISWVRPEYPARVVGLALMTNHLNEAEAHAAIKQAEEETGLPATDAMRFGVQNLLDALLAARTITL